jgi:xylulokinase
MVLFLGIDLGTTGIRAIVVDEKDEIKIKLSEMFSNEKLYNNCQNTSGWHEQNPKNWKNHFNQIIRRILVQLGELKYSAGDIGICTDSTSGTIFPVDANGKPLLNAIMYNDQRAREEAKAIQNVSQNYSKKVGFTFKASFSLPKILWIKNHHLDIYKKTYKFLHANDYLIGLLSGEFFHSDSSNCLKCGYDFVDDKWPDFIENELEISLDKLPEVKRPGSILTKTSTEIEKNLGLPSHIPIIAGCTDSTMALLASGASEYGDIFSSIGTTLVTRVLSPKLLIDPLGRVYSHIFPSKKRIYLPGGASSVGAECLDAYFPDLDFKQFDQKSLDYFPTPILNYPLVKKGERFPFIDENAEHFCLKKTDKEVNKYELYTSYLQSVAFVEKLAINVLEKLGAPIGDRVFTIGGATKSKEWLQIRADVLQKTICRPKIIEAAYGATILAASSILFKKDLLKTIKKFVKQDIVVHPRKEYSIRLDNIYQDFVIEIKKRYEMQL